LAHFVCVCLTGITLDMHLKSAINFI